MATVYLVGKEVTLAFIFGFLTMLQCPFGVLKVEMQLEMGGQRVQMGAS